MDFIANNLVVILLMITGIGLVIVEMFLPGISIPGIAGAIMLFIAIWLIWANYGAFWGLIAGLVVVCLLTAAIIVSLRSARKGRLSKSDLFLRDNVKEAAPEEPFASLVGREGVTQTPLRPSGIMMLDGVRQSVVTEGAYIDAGVTVRIIHTNGSRIVVEPADSKQK